MPYAARLMSDYPRWQALGVEQLEQLPPSQNETLTAVIGKSLGAYGVVGTMFYDIVHNGDAIPPATRAEVATESIWIASTLEIIDTTVDSPAPNRTVDAVEIFVDNCRDIMLDAGQYEIMPDIALPEHQLACYGISRVINRRLGTGYVGKKPAMSDVLARLKSPVLEQFTATDPTDLLRITEQTSGVCVEAITLSSEFVDATPYPEMKRAAYHFGAMGGVLDHGSEILADIREGSNTFPIAYLRQNGVSKATLRDVREMRRAAAHDQYVAGKQLLETRKQRAMYASGARFLMAKHALNRIKESITPQKLEIALKSSEDISARD